VVFYQGDYATARSLYQESLAIRRQLGDKRGIALTLEVLVRLVAAQAQWECALRLAGVAAALREAIGAPLSPTEQARLERHLEIARQVLGEEVSARALADGRVMTLEQAIEYSLAGITKAFGL
jgi:hypothetical protein